MKKTVLILSIILLSTTSFFAQRDEIRNSQKLDSQMGGDATVRGQRELSNISVVDNLYKSYAAGDISNILKSMDPEIIWYEAEGNLYADGNPYIGPDSVFKGVFTRVGADHDYFDLENIEIHEMNNNKVLATLRYHARVKKTGKTYCAQAAHLWTLRNGKITGFQQYVDTRKLTNAVNAYNQPRLKDLNSLSSEVESLLKSLDHKLQKGDSATVFFSIAKDRKIQYVKVAFEDSVHSYLLEKNLKNRQLDGNKWREGKIYELSVIPSANDITFTAEESNIKCSARIP